MASSSCDFSVAIPACCCSATAGCLMHLLLLKERISAACVQINDTMGVAAAVQIEGNALDNETDVHEQVLQQLQLTDQQTDNILTCYGFLSSLYGPVTNHRSQLLQQKHLLHHPSSVTHSSHQDNPPTLTALLGDTEAASSSLQQQQKLQSRRFQWQKSVQQQQQLHWKHQQQHQQYLNTLGINMGKEVTITHIAAFTLWGCLSWSQVAQLILGCYPVPANPLVLAAVIQQQQ